MLSDAEGNYAIDVFAGLDSEFVIPPAGSGFAQTFVSGLNIQGNTLQKIILPFIDGQLPVIVSAPRAVNLTDRSATIEWETDEPTATVLDIGGTLHQVPGHRVLHSVPLTGLSAETAYTGRVAATDGAGNGPVTAAVSFETAAVPDTRPPVIIEGPIVTAISFDRALVEWRTDEPAKTSVGFGAEAVLDGTAGQDGLRALHSVEINWLAAGTAYDVQVTATDASGNGPTLSHRVAFQTLDAPDLTAPAITAGPVVTDITPHSVTIAWETNEPAVSGLSLNDGAEYIVIRDEELKTAHSMLVPGLAPGTDYYFTASATDKAGNGPTLSEERSFWMSIVDGSPPPAIVGRLKIVGITHQSAVVLWQTDKPADGSVEFGNESSALSRMASDAKLRQQHVVHLTDLKPGTRYYLRAKSVDSLGREVASDLGSFVTRATTETVAPQFVVAPTVVGVTDTTATLHWQTSRPSDALVSYGVGDSVTELQGRGLRKLEHTVTLAGLEPGQVYSFSVVSTDVEGNVARFDSIVQPDPLGGSFLPQVDWLDAIGLHKAVAQDGQSSGFVTASEPDIFPPLVLSGSEIIPAGPTEVLVRWGTSEPAVAEVYFSEAGSGEDRVRNEEETRLDHEILLSGLVADSLRARCMTTRSSWPM